MLTAVTVAAETAAPDWSVTLPERLADTWAKDKGTEMPRRSNPKIQQFSQNTRRILNGRITSVDKTRKSFIRLHFISPTVGVGKKKKCI